jgi:tRNA uridine 5-carboxymethylaminomethyl modification enzyme
LPQAVRERFPDEIWSLLENDLKYEGYITRQEVMVERTARMEDKMIPASLDYGQVIGLKREAQIKLGQIRPATLGQAARVQGVTPADIALLGIVLRKGVNSQSADVSN